MEHILVGLIVCKVGGQGADKLERYIRADFPVCCLAPLGIRIRVLNALVHGGNFVLLLNGDVALVGHLKQRGVHGIALARRAGIYQQVITGGKINSRSIRCNRSRLRSQMLCGHIGKGIGFVALIGITAQHSSHVRCGGAGCKDVCAFLDKAGIGFQFRQEGSAVNAGAPGYIAQRNRVVRLRTGENLIGVIAVRCAVRHISRKGNSGHAENHGQHQQKAGQLFKVFHVLVSFLLFGVSWKTWLLFVSWVFQPPFCAGYADTGRAHQH